MSRRTSMENAERRRRKWPVRLLWILAPLVMGTGMLFTTRRVLETCVVCNSIHVMDASGIGTDPFHPWWTAGRSEEVRPSAACRDFFDGNCPHRWANFSSQGGVLFFRVFTGGTLPRQPVAWRYEESDRFHAHVKRMLKEGTLSKEDLRAACSIPAVPAPADLADPEKRRLAALGIALLKESSEEEYARAWADALHPAAAAGANPR